MHVEKNFQQWKLRGGVLRVLEHPHQIEKSKINYIVIELAREEVTHTATDL